jgi:hypothetical protein
VLVVALAVDAALVALVAETALVPVSPSLALVDVALALPCCPVAWNNVPRNCCRAAAIEVATGAEVLEVESVVGVEVALEPDEDVSLDVVNPSTDNAAERACASGFVLPLLLVDGVDEESALVALC